MSETAKLNSKSEFKMCVYLDLTAMKVMTVRVLKTGITGEKRLR